MATIIPPSGTPLVFAVDSNGVILTRNPVTGNQAVAVMVPGWVEVDSVQYIDFQGEYVDVDWTISRINGRSQQEVGGQLGKGVMHPQGSVVKLGNQVTTAGYTMKPENEASSSGGTVFSATTTSEGIAAFGTYPGNNTIITESVGVRLNRNSLGEVYITSNGTQASIDFITKLKTEGSFKNTDENYSAPYICQWVHHRDIQLQRDNPNRLDGQWFTYHRPWKIDATTGDPSYSAYYPIDQGFPEIGGVDNSGLNADNRRDGGNPFYADWGNISNTYITGVFNPDVDGSGRFPDLFERMPLVEFIDAGGNKVVPYRFPVLAIEAIGKNPNGTWNARIWLADPDGFDKDNPIVINDIGGGPGYWTASSSQPKTHTDSKTFGYLKPQYRWDGAAIAESTILSGLGVTFNSSEVPNAVTQNLSIGLWNNSNPPRSDLVTKINNIKNGSWTAVNLIYFDQDRSDNHPDNFAFWHTDISNGGGIQVQVTMDAQSGRANSSDAGTSVKIFRYFKQKNEVGNTIIETWDFNAKEGEGNNYNKPNLVGATTQEDQGAGIDGLLQDSYASSFPVAVHPGGHRTSISWTVNSSKYSIDEVTGVQTWTGTPVSSTTPDDKREALPITKAILSNNNNREFVLYQPWNQLAYGSQWLVIAEGSTVHDNSHFTDKALSSSWAASTTGMTRLGYPLSFIRDYGYLSLTANGDPEPIPTTPLQRYWFYVDSEGYILEGSAKLVEQVYANASSVPMHGYDTSLFMALCEEEWFNKPSSWNQAWSVEAILNRSFALWPGFYCDHPIKIYAKELSFGSATTGLETNGTFQPWTFDNGASHPANIACSAPGGFFEATFTGTIHQNVSNKSTPLDPDGDGTNEYAQKNDGKVKINPATMTNFNGQSGPVDGSNVNNIIPEGWYYIEILDAEAQGDIFDNVGRRWNNGDDWQPKRKEKSDDDTVSGEYAHIVTSQQSASSYDPATEIATFGFNIDDCFENNILLKPTTERFMYAIVWRKHLDDTTYTVWGQKNITVDQLSGGGLDVYYSESETVWLAIPTQAGVFATGFPERGEYICQIFEDDATYQLVVPNSGEAWSDWKPPRFRDVNETWYASMDELGIATPDAFADGIDVLAQSSVIINNICGNTSNNIYAFEVAADGKIVHRGAFNTYALTNTSNGRSTSFYFEEDAQNVETFYCNAGFNVLVNKESGGSPWLSAEQIQNAAEGQQIQLAVTLTGSPWHTSTGTTRPRPTGDLIAKLTNGNVLPPGWYAVCDGSTNVDMNGRYTGVMPNLEATITATVSVSGTDIIVNSGKAIPSGSGTLQNCFDNVEVKYELYDADNMGDGVQADFNTTIGTQKTFSNLSSGNYIVKLSHGWSSSSGPHFEGIDLIQTLAISDELSIATLWCSGDSDNRASIEVIGGNGYVNTPQGVAYNGIKSCTNPNPRHFVFEPGYIQGVAEQKNLYCNVQWTVYPSEVTNGNITPFTSEDDVCNFTGQLQPINVFLTGTPQDDIQNNISSTGFRITDSNGNPLPDGHYAVCIGDSEFEASEITDVNGNILNKYKGVSPNTKATITVTETGEGFVAGNVSVESADTNCLNGRNAQLIISKGGFSETQVLTLNSTSAQPFRFENLTNGEYTLGLKNRITGGSNGWEILKDNVTLHQISQTVSGPSTDNWCKVNIGSDPTSDNSGRTHYIEIGEDSKVITSGIFDFANVNNWGARRISTDAFRPFLPNTNNSADDFENSQMYRSANVISAGGHYRYQGQTIILFKPDQTWADLSDIRQGSGLDANGNSIDSPTYSTGQNIACRIYGDGIVDNGDLYIYQDNGFDEGNDVTLNTNLAPGFYGICIQNQDDIGDWGSGGIVPANQRTQIGAITYDASVDALTSTVQTEVRSSSTRFTQFYGEEFPATNWFDVAGVRNEYQDGGLELGVTLYLTRVPAKDGSGNISLTSHDISQWSLGSDFDGPTDRTSSKKLAAEAYLSEEFLVSTVRFGTDGVEVGSGFYKFQLLNSAHIGTIIQFTDEDALLDTRNLDIQLSWCPDNLYTFQVDNDGNIITLIGSGANAGKKGFLLCDGGGAGISFEDGTYCDVEIQIAAQETTLQPWDDEDAACSATTSGTIQALLKGRTSDDLTISSSNGTSLSAGWYSFCSTIEAGGAINVAPTPPCGGEGDETWIYISSDSGDWDGNFYNCDGVRTSSISESDWFDEAPMTGFFVNNGSNDLPRGPIPDDNGKPSICDLCDDEIEEIEFLVSGNLVDFTSDSEKLRLYESPGEEDPWSEGWYRACQPVGPFANASPPERSKFNCYGKPFVWYSTKKENSMVVDADSYLTNSDSPWYRGAPLKDLTSTGCDLAVWYWSGIGDTEKQTLLKDTYISPNNSTVMGCSGVTGSSILFDSSVASSERFPPFLSRAPFGYHPDFTLSQKIISSKKDSATEMVIAVLFKNTIETNGFQNALFKISDLDTKNFGHEAEDVWSQSEFTYSTIELFVQVGTASDNIYTLKTSKWNGEIETAAVEISGPPITTNSGTHLIVMTLSDSGHSMRIDGLEYASNENPSLFCDGDIGITNMSIDIGWSKGMITKGPADGHFLEMVVYDKQLTISEIEELEGSISHKWCHLLEDPHPYRTSQPTCSECEDICCESSVSVATTVIDQNQDTNPDTLQLICSYTSTESVYGYQFWLSGLDSLSLQNGFYGIGDTIPAGSGKQFTLNFFDTMNKDFVNYIQVFDEGIAVYGRIGGDVTKFLPAGTNRFLTIHFTESSPSHNQDWSSITDAIVVESVSGIDHPYSPNTVLATYDTNNPEKPVSAFSGDFDGDGIVDVGDVDEIIKRIVNSRINGPYDLSGVSWLETLDTSGKGWLDICDAITLAIHIFANGGTLDEGDGVESGLNIHNISTPACQEKLVPMLCEPCECPDFLKPQECYSRAWISDIQPIGGKGFGDGTGLFGIVTVSYQSSCCLDGYKLVLGGYREGVVGTTPYHDGVVFVPNNGDTIGQISIGSETHINGWIHGVTLDPSYKGEVALQNSDAIADVFSNNLSGGSVTNVEEGQDTLNFPIVWGISPAGASIKDGISSEEERLSQNCIPATCGNESKILTRFVVNLRSFNNPTIEEFRLITNDDRRTPQSGWSGDTNNNNLIDTQDILIGFMYLCAGYGPNTQWDTALGNSITPISTVLDAEEDGEYFDIVDFMTLTNHRFLSGGDSEPDNTLLITPTDCCPCDAPEDFDTTIVAYPCDPTDPNYVSSKEGKIDISWTPSLNAKGYKIYRTIETDTTSVLDYGNFKDIASVLNKDLMFTDSINSLAYIEDYSKLLAFKDKVLNKTKTTISDKDKFAVINIVDSDTTSMTDSVDSIIDNCCPEEVLPKIKYTIIAFNECGETLSEQSFRPICCAPVPEAKDVNLGELSINSQAGLTVDVFMEKAFSPFGECDESVSGYPNVCSGLSFFITGIEYTGPKSENGIFTGPSGGDIFPTVNSTGFWLWKPPENYIGDVIFTYTVVADNGCSAEATIKVTYAPKKLILDCYTPPCGSDEYGNVHIKFTLPKVDNGGKFTVLRKETSDSAEWDPATHVIKDDSGEALVFDIADYNSGMFLFNDKYLPKLDDCCTVDLFYTYVVYYCLTAEKTSASYTEGKIYNHLTTADVPTYYCSYSTECEVIIPCCGRPHNPIPSGSHNIDCEHSNYGLATLTWDPVTTEDNIEKYVIWKKGNDEVWGVVDTVDAAEDEKNPNWDAGTAKFTYSIGAAASKKCGDTRIFNLAVTSINSDGVISGKPNDEDWGTGTDGDPCSAGGVTVQINVPPCPPALCPENIDVSICLDDDFTYDLSKFVGCVPTKISGEKVSLTYNITSWDNNIFVFEPTIDGSIVSFTTRDIGIDKVGLQEDVLSVQVAIVDSDCSDTATISINLTLIDCGCACSDDEADYSICDNNVINGEYTSDGKMKNGLEQPPFSLISKGGQTLRKGQPYVVSRGTVECV